MPLKSVIDILASVSAGIPALPVVWSVELGDYATSLSISRDGTLVAVGTAAGEVWAFDTSTGALRFRRAAHQDGVLAVAWSPQQRCLATAGQDGQARLFDAEGDELATLPGGAPWVEHLAWAPDGKHLASAAGRAARIWTSAAKLVLETEPNESTVSGVAWNRKSTELATACYGSVSLFKARARVRYACLAWTGSLISLAWSPTDAVIACGTQERSVHFWRLPSRRNSQISGFTAKPRALAWDAEGRLLATAGDAAVSVWSFDGKGPEGKEPMVLHGHEALCTALAFHPKQARLASGADDTTVLVWDPRANDTPYGQGFMEETVTHLGWGNGGRFLIGTDAAGTLRAWQTEG